jgi:hypothetical protein
MKWNTAWDACNVADGASSLPPAEPHLKSSRVLTEPREFACYAAA